MGFGVKENELEITILWGFDDLHSNFLRITIRMSSFLYFFCLIVSYLQSNCAITFGGFYACGTHSTNLMC